MVVCEARFVWQVLSSNMRAGWSWWSRCGLSPCCARCRLRVRLFFRLWDGGDCAALCEGGVYTGLGLRLLFEVGVGCAAELLVALRLLRWSDHYYYPAPTRIGTSIRILTLVSIGTAISIRARIPG